MQRIGTSLRLSLAAAAALLLIGTGAGPVRAQMSAMDHDAAVPCSAFQRMGGAWTAVAPVTLNIDNGMSLSFAAGDTMAAGSTVTPFSSRAEGCTWAPGAVPLASNSEDGRIASG